jgi:PadR family transcriptional regulator, regulatory protein AphA
MAKGNRTIFTLLGMLSIEPISSYESKQAIHNSTAFFWSESEWQIYPTLAECVKKGFAACREENLNNAQRIKQIYKIMPKGKQALTDWLTKTVNPSIVRNELLLKLFLGAYISISENIHHIKNFEKEAKKYLITLQNIRDQTINKRKNTTC